MIEVLRQHGHLIGVQVSRRRFVSDTLTVNSCLLTACPGGLECTARARTLVGQRIREASDDELERWLRDALNDPDDGRAFDPPEYPGI